jgi:hypothetical protein
MSREGRRSRGMAMGSAAVMEGSGAGLEDPRGSPAFSSRDSRLALSRQWIGGSVSHSWSHRGEGKGRDGPLFCSRTLFLAFSVRGGTGPSGGIPKALDTAGASPLLRRLAIRSVGVIGVHLLRTGPSQTSSNPVKALTQGYPSKHCRKERLTSKHTSKQHHERFHWRFPSRAPAIS